MVLLVSIQQARRAKCHRYRHGSLQTRSLMFVKAMRQLEVLLTLSRSKKSPSFRQQYCNHVPDECMTPSNPSHRSPLITKSTESVAGSNVSKVVELDLNDLTAIGN